MPWPIPNHCNAVSYPYASMTSLMGTTDTAAPAPNPAAVRPAASPRRSGPFQCIAHAGAVDRPGSDAGQCAGNVQQRQRRRVRIQGPCKSDEHASEADNNSRSEPINKPSLDGHEPSLCGNEDAERHLDRRSAPMVLGINGVDEQGPTVLQVGDHDHADYTAYKLNPAIDFTFAIDLAFALRSHCSQPG